MSYVVIQPGDTLAAIAERYGVTIETLKGLNPSLDERFEPGMRLILGKPVLRVSVETKKTGATVTSNEPVAAEKAVDKRADTMPDTEKSSAINKTSFLPGMLPHVFHRPYLFPDSKETPLALEKSSEVSDHVGTRDAFEQTAFPVQTTEKLTLSNKASSNKASTNKVSTNKVSTNKGSLDETSAPKTLVHHTSDRKHASDQTVFGEGRTQVGQTSYVDMDLERIRAMSARAFIYPQSAPTPAVPAAPSHLPVRPPLTNGPVPGLVPRYAQPWGIVPIAFYSSIYSSLPETKYGPVIPSPAIPPVMPFFPFANAPHGSLASQSSAPPVQPLQKAASGHGKPYGQDQPIRTVGHEEKKDAQKEGNLSPKQWAETTKTETTKTTKMRAKQYPVLEIDRWMIEES
ncbi:MAG: hypothetical protein BSOLF_0695 [Candidatus Carbobacillus altaicus]|uniref:LysM domain-containing protein n=1 Tax=Candidatus Carbonibacillus altaicus TaxID=2163959 RepID=A0A2R6Y5A0_9BACL|nr:MAG: hypothetical protein BSOLF_0695 [Candidatus Carbobacillus altaicus]